MAEFIKSARDAEHAAARAMKTLGFSDAEATPVGPDAGIDVRSREALAQVKWKGGVAGRPDLQRLYGACAGQHHKAMLFYSASGYSKSAIAYAAQVKIALFEYDPLGAVDPQNSIARGLVEKSRRSKSSERQGLAMSEAVLPRIATETREDPDLLRWMASTNFMSDPTSVPVQEPSVRDEYKKRAAEFRQRGSSSGKTANRRLAANPPELVPTRSSGVAVILIFLVFAFLAGLFLVQLVIGPLAPAWKVILGGALVLGGLFSLGVAGIGVRELRSPSSPADKS